MASESSAVEFRGVRAAFAFFCRQERAGSGASMEERKNPGSRKLTENRAKSKIEMRIFHE